MTNQQTNKHARTHTHTQGVPKKWLRERKQFPDTWGANYWWWSLCTMASAAFCYASNLFLDTLYIHRHSHWHKPSDIGLLCFFRTSCAHQCVLSHQVISRLTQTHASKRLFVQHIQHWPQMIFINHGTFFFLFIGIQVVQHNLNTNK